MTNTRLRLRKTRVPETNERHWYLTQFVDAPDGNRSTEIVMELTAAEYEVFSIFEANEIRKNRYRYLINGVRYYIDLYLGPLWGLVIAKPVEEEVEVDPRFDLVVSNISGDQMFSGQNLAEITIQEIRERFRTSNVAPMVKLDVPIGELE